MPKVKKENKGKRLRQAALELHGTVVSEAAVDKVLELRNELKDDTKTPAILLQLESNVVAEREEACNALANIVLDVEEDQAIVSRGGVGVLRRLLLNGIVARLTQRLSDGSFPVRVAAMGALRNLTLAVDSTPTSSSTSEGLLSDAFLASSGDRLMLIFSAARQAINTLVGITNNDQSLISSIQQQNLAALGPQPTSREKTEEGVPSAPLSGPSAASIYLDCVEILEHGIAFLWHLSEISDKATELITNSGALPALLPYLDLRTTSILEKIDEGSELQNKLKELRHGGEGSDLRHRLAITTAQFFNVVIEENPKAVNALMTARPDVLDWLRSLILVEQANPQSNPELRAQLAGFLYILCCKRQQPNFPELEEQAIQFLLPILLSLVDQSPIDQWLNVCLPPLSNIPPPPFLSASSSSSGSELSNEQEVAMQTVAKGLSNISPTLRGLQFALEVLTNIFTSPEDSKGEEEVEEADTEEVEGMEEDVNMEEGEEGAEGNSEANPLTSPTLQKELPSVLTRVLPRAGPIPGQVLKLTGEWPSLLKPSVDLLFRAQLRAITCLGNILSVIPRSGLLNIADVWNLFCEVCAQASSLILIENLEAVAAASWTLLRKYKQQIPLTSASVQGLIFMATNQLSSDIRMTALGMLGIMGQLPMFADAATLTNIANTLLQALTDTSPLVVAEALNSIFDIFAETDHNQVVKATGIMNRLRQFLPVLRQALRTEKRKMEKWDWHRLDEARINLTRFIEYKKNQDT